MPILTTEEGIGERRILAEMQSDINGCAALHAHAYPGACALKTAVCLHAGAPQGSCSA